MMEAKLSSAEVRVSAAALEESLQCARDRVYAPRELRHLSGQRLVVHGVKHV